MIHKDVLEMAEKLIHTLRNKKWVCFGAGLRCHDFLKNFCVEQKIFPLPAYACDNNKARWGQTIQSVPICSPDELDKENPSNCVIVVTATEPFSIMSELFTSRAKYYFEIATVNQIESYLTFIAHQDEFLTVYDHLADEKSKKIYSGILSGCMAGNLTFPMFYSNNPYWDNDVVGRLNDNDLVVIGGAYDGKHIDRAFASNPTVTVHGFEPNEDVFDNLKSKYNDNPNVILYDYALYNKDTILSFDTTSILGARVVETMSTPSNGGGAVHHV